MTQCPYTLQWDAGTAMLRATVSAPSFSRPLLNTMALRVRPANQPVPSDLEGTLLGRQFAHWLRQRDDPARSRSKSSLAQALTALPSDIVRAHAHQQAALARMSTWDHWTWTTPVATIASLLGVPLPSLRAQEALLAKMQGIANGLSGRNVLAADSACAELLAILDKAEGPLQEIMLEYAPPSQWLSEDDFSANRLALLWQGYEAGAALLGNALKCMSEIPALRHTRDIQSWLIQLISDGGAIRNTRRFTAETLRLNDMKIEMGTTVVVELGGDLGFGSGHHLCPGQDIAITTVSAALEWLLASGIESWPAVANTLVLPNASIPLFCNGSIAR